MIELSTPTAGTHGRVALVTGAARGIGLGIAAWLISEGWQVVLTDLDRARGSKVAKVLGENAWFIAMDVAEESQVALGVAEVLGQFGRLDALVCNAAVADPHNITLESLDLAYWNRVLAVNLSGPMLLAKHCAPYLRAHNGSIVNLASTRARQSEADSGLMRRARAACWRLRMRWRSVWGRRFASTRSVRAGLMRVILLRVALSRWPMPIMLSIRRAG